MLSSLRPVFVPSIRASVGLLKELRFRTRSVGVCWGPAVTQTPCIDVNFDVVVDSAPPTLEIRYQHDRIL